MYLNLKQIINDLLLQESVREVDTFINQQRDEIEKETLRTFFNKFKTYSGSNPDQTLAQIKVPFFKWLFNVSSQQNPNITDQELNSFFDTSILYFNNKNKFNFNFQLNPTRPTWNAFETEVLEKTSEQRERQTEESTLVQLLSKDVNTRWFENLSDSKVNKPEIIKKFKTWNENSKLSKQEKENNILVVEPRTTLSAKFWGNPRCFGVDVGYGVKWCTSATESGNMFYSYAGHSGSRLIYIIDLSQPDQNPWQKIAVLIHEKRDPITEDKIIEIFDATDQKYSLEELKSHIKPEIFQLIDEKIIDHYYYLETEQYSPIEIHNLSQEEKYILFLTTLRDPSSRDMKYVAQHFKEFFSSPTTSEHDRKQIIKNLIGSSDYDETLINLIDKYLNDSNASQNFYKYHEIIKYLNSPEKQSKAAMKFYDNRTFFSENENYDIWELFEKYLNNEQKRKIAIKFVLNHDVYFNVNWYQLSDYLQSDELSKAALKLLNKDAQEKEANDYLISKLISYLNENHRIQIIESYLLNKEKFDTSAWKGLYEYLSNQEKIKAAQNFLLNEEKIINNFNPTSWIHLSEYLTEEEKLVSLKKAIFNNGKINFNNLKTAYDRIHLPRKQISDLFFDFIFNLEINDFKRNLEDKEFMSIWEIYLLSRIFTQDQKDKIYEKFVLSSNNFDNFIYKFFGFVNISFENKRKTAEKFILNQKEIFCNNIKSKHTEYFSLFYDMRSVLTDKEIFTIAEDCIARGKDIESGLLDLLLVFNEDIKKEIKEKYKSISENYIRKIKLLKLSINNLI